MNDELEQRRGRRRAVADTPPTPEAPATVEVLPVERFTYDTETLGRFIDVVFAHVDPKEEEQGASILTWRKPRTSHLGYPLDWDTLLSRLGGHPAALYYGTSTCVPEAGGALRNRKSQFCALHVIVLDDIGTKVAELPEALRDPTYIIESSPGNFQYGYALDAPITDYPAAQALVQLIYQSGYTDAGGGLVTKLVRLPDGINGKPDINWRVQLRHLQPRYWSPQELLTAARCDVKWTDIVADARKTLQRQRRVNISHWAPMVLDSDSSDGLIDPVAEWLSQREMVCSDHGEWITIRCPWADTHTSGDDTAGYSPIGRGEGDNKIRRGFHCFHEHCAGHKTPAFLAWVAEEGGPEVGVSEHSAWLVRDWVFDASNNAVIDLRTADRISMDAFRNLEPRKVRVPAPAAASGMKLVPITELWRVSPLRVSVRGQTYDPTTTARLLAPKDGGLLFNLFNPPAWPSVDIDQDHIANFLDFLTYLIPDQTDREFFLDWLAAKTQDLSFRGPAILMTTQVQGTGRTTLADMLHTLFGGENVMNLPFERLVGNNDFNEWQERPLVVVDETYDVGQDNSRYKAYERMKDLVDFRPKMVRINPKYGSVRTSLSCTSFLLYSNHMDAVALSPLDRRVYCVRNTGTPASPEYFTQLNEWIGQEEWPPHLWTWLRRRPVDLQALHKPAALTETKQQMIQASRSRGEVLVDSILEAWEGRFITAAVVAEIAGAFERRLDLPSDWRVNQCRKLVNERTDQLYREFKIRSKFDNKQHRVRAINARMSVLELSTYKVMPPSEMRVEARDEFNANDMAKVLERVEELLRDAEVL